MDLSYNHDGLCFVCFANGCCMNLQKPDGMCLPTPSLPFLCCPILSTVERVQWLHPTSAGCCKIQLRSLSGQRFCSFSRCSTQGYQHICNIAICYVMFTDLACCCCLILVSTATGLNLLQTSRGLGSRMQWGSPVNRHMLSAWCCVQDSSNCGGH